MGPTIPVSGVDLSDLLVFATRYTLGRATYAPGTVCQILRRHLPHILMGDLRTIIRDIRTHAQKTDLGHAMDAADWMATLGLLEAELERREEGNQP